MKLAERWMLPCANKSTACSSPQLDKEPLHCWALLERNTRGSKHLESNWALLQRLPVLQALHQEDLKAPPCRWFKDTTWRCSKNPLTPFQPCYNQNSNLRLCREPLPGSVCCVLLHSEQRKTARRTITSSKIRYKKTERQHFEEAVPSFKEVVKQDRDLKTQRNKQTILA